MGKQAKCGKAQQPKPTKKPDLAFKKVKAKVGKKLPKTNETVISIKTRKIVLPTQHETKKNSYVFKGKSVSEYLAATKHTNSNHRIQNMVNLHEMLSNHPSLVQPNAGSVIERLGILIQDPEEGCRSSALVLAKTFLSNIKGSEIAPFLEVFIAQLSSGMLHIDKGVQKTTVYVMISLFQSHIAQVIPHLGPLISSLTILLSAHKNKTNLLMYFNAIGHIYRHVLKPSVSSKLPVRQKTAGVSLYKFTSRKQTGESNSARNELLTRLFEASLPHIERFWMEDAPSQVYAHVEPVALKNCLTLVGLLLLFHKTHLALSTASQIKINSLTKSLVGRFPLVCSIPNRDSQLLWSLNHKIAQYLALCGCHAKVEQYLVSCFDSTSQALSVDEITADLVLLSELPSPSAAMQRCLLRHSTTPSSPHSSLFLSHLVRTGQLQNIDPESTPELMRSLRTSIKSVATDLINCFFTHRALLTPDILHLCLEKCVFGALSETDQIRCLELCYSCSPEWEVLAGVGQSVNSSAARNKFSSILLALYHDGRVEIADYISIILTQANREDETGDSPSMEQVSSFTKPLISALAPLPAEIHANLLSIATPQIVERLYSGLSSFSLMSYLIILLELNRYRLEGSEEEIPGLPLTGEETTTTTLVLPLPEEPTKKLCKIICSLIFNKTSLSDWGEEVLKLATTLAIESEPIFRYATSTMVLDNKPVEVLVWFLRTTLRIRRGRLGEGFRAGMESMYKSLMGRAAEPQIKELQFRMNMEFETQES